ncbi:unnamed protein product, partial [Polarella glacialis]
DTTRNGPIMRRIAENIFFKTVCIVAIAANTVYMGMVADFNVKNTYRRVQGQSMVQEWETPDVVFCTWFSLEIVIKIAAYKKEFFLGEDKTWNLFDSALVAESVTSVIFKTGSGLAFLRILRVFRLIRVVRVVRSVKALRRLRTMIFAMISSFVDLMWAFLVILLILFVFGIIFTNGVSGYFEDVDVTDAEKVLQAGNVREHFGSLYESMVSLWCSISGGNDWMQYGASLRIVGDGDESYFGLFCFYIAFCVVGLMNVVTGIFVDSAVCTRSEDEVVQGYVDDLQRTTEEIKKFFQSADGDHSGTLSFSEFERHLTNPTVKAYFAGLDIDPDEAKIIFTLLDVDRSGEIMIDEFVNGTMKLKGYAKSMDLLCLMYDSTRL